MDPDDGRLRPREKRAPAFEGGEGETHRLGLSAREGRRADGEGGRRERRVRRSLGRRRQGGVYGEDRGGRPLRQGGGDRRRRTVGGVASPAVAGKTRDAA